MVDASDLQRVIVEQARVPEGSFLISAADGDLAVRLDGFAAGTSLSYAARRRRIVNRIVRERAGKMRLRPVVVFQWSDGIARIEAAIKAVLHSSLGVEPEKVSVAVGKHSFVHVSATFLAPHSIKGSHNQQIRSLVEALVVGAGGRMREQGLHLSFPGPTESVPTLAAIVRSVRVAQPTSLEQLIALFRNRGFAALTPSILNAQLDLARQRGLITQMSGRFFAVTALGIAANPSITGRKSTDVERALALGRRTGYSFP